MWGTGDGDMTRDWFGGSSLGSSFVHIGCLFGLRKVSVKSLASGAKCHNCCKGCFEWILE